MADLPDSEAYDASCIKITSGAQFDWAIEGSLAAKYGRDLGFIQRGLLACKLAGIGFDFFIQRYLEGDKSIPRNPLVEEIFWEQAKQVRWGEEIDSRRKSKKLHSETSEN